MRIAFDGTTLRPGRTGVGYYTEHLLHHLAQERRDDDLFIVSNRPVDTTRPLPTWVTLAMSPCGVPRMVWMQTLAPRMLRRLRVDVAHFTNGMVPLASPDEWNRVVKRRYADRIYEFQCGSQGDGTIG